MKIDFHVHTNISPCSNMSLKNAVETAINSGLSGIAVCNHNVSFLKSDIPYELEKELNIKINPVTLCENAFYIIPGIEISINGGHFLGLFIEKEVEYSDRYIDQLSNAGGIVVFAHPFEHSSNYSKRSDVMEYFLPDIDLIETRSSRASYKNKDAVSQALTFSKEYQVNECAGSDAHFVHEIGNAWVEFDDSVIGLDAIKDALLNGDVTCFCKNAKRVDIAKSQIIKHGYTPKTVLFYIYSLIRDIGDRLCQKSH